MLILLTDNCMQSLMENLQNLEKALSKEKDSFGGHGLWDDEGTFEQELMRCLLQRVGRCYSIHLATVHTPHM